MHSRPFALKRCDGFAAELPKLVLHTALMRYIDFLQDQLAWWDKEYMKIRASRDLAARVAFRWVPDRSPSISGIASFFE